MTIQKINMPKARFSLLVRGSIPAVVTTLIGIELGFFIEQAVSPADRTSVNQCFLGLICRLDYEHSSLGKYFVMGLLLIC